MNAIIATPDAAVTALKEMATNAPRPLLCLRIEVPKKAIHSFFEHFVGEKTGWLPNRSATAQQGDWSVAGAGATIVLEASRNTRFQAIRLQAEKQFERIDIRSNAPNSHFPNLRFYGGGAFVPAASQDSIWGAFSDARFIIPRWQYATQSQDGTLQLVIDAEEFHTSRVWQNELHDIFHWLKKEDPLRMPATQSVNITHFSNGWETLVHDALNEIHAGTLHKVVVSRMSHLKSNLDFSLQRCLERLDNSYADCTRFVFGGEDGVFIGATPEQLIRVSEQGHRFAADALAGSAQRSSRTDTATALQHSEKERREFEFVLSNIESQFRQSGIRITSEREIKIKSLKNLFHLHCPVTGVSDIPIHALDMVSCLHPTPAVCGTPTRAATQWLADNEHQSRGWYAGPIGWFNASGDGDFAVGIRSALLKENEAWLFAGAGIVNGSSAAVEFTETGAKLMPMLSALGAI
ncbi:MAG: isochorismate synthase [Deltaproteobacteria bacterium]|nr:isochorismate synthase [Deltaproteobacteria bacterium]MBN2670603.1 isochorismate synthase [Deltaproteobacteria bacterium]